MFVFTTCSVNGLAPTQSSGCILVGPVRPFTRSCGKKKSLLKIAENGEMDASAMKSINLTLYNVILKGENWSHVIPPCSKGAVALLANNESIVTWISPKDETNDCLKHIPVILYKGKYWTLSLRMSKCIYRHVRLRKGFENRQTVHGVVTLRIPQLLLNEKKRTQARFEVRFLG